MDTALQSSVYVSSPEFAGWLMKRGFHVINTCLFLAILAVINSFSDDYIVA